MVFVKAVLPEQNTLVPLRIPPETPREKVFVEANHASMTAVLYVLAHTTCTHFRGRDQLGMLFQLSHSVFHDLLTDANKLCGRISHLRTRVNHIAQYVPDTVKYLGAATAEQFLPNPAMAYRAQVTEEIQLFSKDTLPATVGETYEKGMSPPNLSVLDQFAEDGESCLKKYTNPFFFIEVGYPSSYHWKGCAVLAGC